MTDDIKALNLESEVKPGAEKKPAEAAKTAEPMETKGKGKKKTVSLMLVLVVLGAASGYGLFKMTQPQAPQKLKSSTEGGVEKGDLFGVTDEKAFRDMAEGKLLAGGIDGEGSHHLEREGGVSQNVYLTSSIIDLDQFVDRQVKVWGETFEAQKAGWLMDVGRLEVLE